MKEYLSLPASKFGTKLSISQDFIRKVQKSPIIENRSRRPMGPSRVGLSKLFNANNAGTKHVKDCALIRMEGDSARSLAVAKFDQTIKNEEIQNIKKVMCLQHNKGYSDAPSLRCGRLMIMTDQNHDGSHIKGLLINFLDRLTYRVDPTAQSLLNSGSIVHRKSRSR
ncbi:DNA topoisomerase 2 [Marasmius sp. AFHP31]|nr:DNA topoisomerase 2 [Marasmius sp. AFHP31]